MKIINQANRLVGDCPVVDPLTFLVGCQQEVVSRVKRKFVFGPVGLSMMSYRLWFTTVKDYLKGVINGKTTIPVKAWKTEYAKLTNQRKTLNQRYLELKEEVKEAEKIRKKRLQYLAAGTAGTRAPKSAGYGTVTDRAARIIKDYPAAHVLSFSFALQTRTCLFDQYLSQRVSHKNVSIFNSIGKAKTLLFPKLLSSNMFQLYRSRDSVCRKFILQVFNTELCPLCSQSFSLKRVIN